MTIEAIPAAPDPKPLRASVWHRNGDHPDDGVGKEAVDPLTGETYKRLEGRVVRWYMRPDRPEGQECPQCWKPWKVHGWIDEGENGLTVCPGMLVVDLTDGTHAVTKVGQVYRDRNDHYVPAGLSLNGKEQFAEVSEGNRGRSAAGLEVYMSAAAGVISHLLAIMDGTAEIPADVVVHAARQWLATCAKPAPYETFRAPRKARIALAMPDEHNRRGGNDWWWADLSADGEPPGSHWSAFRGHRVQVDVELHTSNSREVNDWKGRDEIRPGGEWSISLNRQPIDGDYFGSDVPGTLRKIAAKVEAMTGDGSGSCPAIDFTDPRPFREQLIGRRVYYHDHPAVITDTVLGQGCVILKPVGMRAFPRTAVDLDEAPDGTGHDEQDLYDEGEARTAKVELDSPHIWWWRRRPFSADEPDGRYRPERGVTVEVGPDEQGKETGDDLGSAQA